MTNRIEQLATQFEQHYSNKPVSLFRAPARINIIGEHIDYVSYMPTSSLAFGSSENDMLMLARPSNHSLVRGASTHPAFEPFAFDLHEIPAGTRQDNLESRWREHIFSAAVPKAHWSNYIRGAATFARFKFGASVNCGFDFILDSNLMPGGGASSSSALLILAGAALREANALTVDPPQLARDSSLAEWYLGTRGGALDHIVICLSLPERAIHLRHADQSVTQVPLASKDFSWLTFFSHPAHKGHELMLEYNERAVVSRVIIPALLDGADISELKSAIEDLPGEIRIAELEGRWPSAYQEGMRLFPDLFKSGRNLKIRERAEHHYGEALRAEAAARLLTLGNDAEVMKRLGLLLDESHASLRDLYDVSTAQVEQLRTALKAGPGVLGARLMGGGFGGNVLALAKTEAAPRIIDRVQAEFYSPRGRDARAEHSVMISTPGAGLTQMALE